MDVYEEPGRDGTPHAASWLPRVTVVALVSVLVAAAGVGGFALADRSGRPGAVSASSTLDDRRVGEPEGTLDATSLPDLEVLPDGSLAGRGAGVVGDDYPYKHLQQDSQYDPWREYVRECTSFAAWALHSRNGFEMPFFADAKNWGPKARTLGFRVDSAPAVGAIAWSDAGTWGHVAWVAVVDGGSVTIEEYNRKGDGRYSTRTVPASSYRYIHFKDISDTPTAPAAPQVPSPAPVVAVPVPAPATPPAPAGTPTDGASSAPTNEAPSSGPATGQPPAVPAAPAPAGSASTPSPSPSAAAPPSAPPAGPPATPPSVISIGQSGSHGSPTFQNVSNASGQGPTVPAMSSVEISCKVRPSSTIASAQPDGYWYRIHSAPWNDQYYAVANTFWNGDVPGQRPYTHNVDPSIPDC